jgi:hypothetical protein
MRTVLIIFLSLFPALAQAACKGTDISAQLPPGRLAAAEAAAAAQPYAEGNHWIARRNGQTIHLIGTLHVSDPRMDAIMQHLGPVASRSGRLYLESTIAEQEAFQASLASDTSKVFLDGPTLIDLMGEEDWQLLSAELRSRGMAPWMAAKMKPWFLSTLLAMPPCLAADPSAIHGLDRRLSDAAQAAGVDVASLENPEVLISLMDSAPLEQQISQLKAGLAAFGGGEDGLATVTEAYFAGKAPLAMEVLKQAYLMESPAEADLAAWDDVIALLLDQRNRAWIEVILAEDAPLFTVAAGAGHLAGEQGLLKLLSDAGFSLERAKF